MQEQNNKSSQYKDWNSCYNKFFTFSLQSINKKNAAFRECDLFGAKI